MKKLECTYDDIHFLIRLFEQSTKYLMLWNYLNGKYRPQKYHLSKNSVIVVILRHSSLYPEEVSVRILMYFLVMLTHPLCLSVFISHLFILVRNQCLKKFKSKLCINICNDKPFGTKEKSLNNISIGNCIVSYTFNKYVLNFVTQETWFMTVDQHRNPF